ncbi:hypothetical protein B0H14DRAFT_3462536 [Mycena olivaceomarginata]|nr:hypothetical protein B0H14DRAFT_3462536 [Mycena olivaceomarginata]
MHKLLMAIKCSARIVVVVAHRTNPLHRIESEGAGGYVSNWTPPWRALHEPVPLHSQFVVLHVTASMKSRWTRAIASAGHGRSPEEQLQRAGWFPIHGHPAEDKSTNNAGTQAPQPLQRLSAACARVFASSDAQALRRGHANSGVMGTTQGELAVCVPCCPIPGVNLPEGWENAPPEHQSLYILFIAIDTCFRLKRRLVSSVLKDPSLGSGWAYMVETMLYRSYLLTVTDQKEMSTCSGLAALDHANTKFSPERRRGSPKGERYANMDWIAACIMIAKDPRLRKIISYDQLIWSE